MHSLAAVIAICWIVFWLYWIVSAFGSEKGTIANPKQFVRIRLGVVILAAGLALLFDRLPQSLKAHPLGTSRIVLALGLIAFLFGLAVAVQARIQLGKNWGLPMMQKPNPKLVTSGPYRYVRHPIYSGMLLMALGSMIDVNIYWLLVFIVATVFFTYSAVTEERLMAQQFPKDYPSYKAKTKMFIPFVL
jgi:protein-S-isoprenylcysteine O-methyltransferase Ste14